MATSPERLTEIITGGMTEAFAKPRPRELQIQDAVRDVLALKPTVDEIVDAREELRVRAGQDIDRILDLTGEHKLPDDGAGYLVSVRDAQTEVLSIVELQLRGDG